MTARIALLASMALLLGTACDADPPDAGAPATQLPLPDVDGIDFSAAYVEALEVVFATDMRAVWAGHRQSLDTIRPGCPDLWLGDVEDPEEDGISWQDHCTTTAGYSYDGILTWTSEAAREGDPKSILGSIESGRRTLFGDGTVHDDDAGSLVFDFGGTGEDAFTSNVSADYLQWSYSSTVRGEALGVAGFGEGSPLPGGWRADLYVAYSGGTTYGVEARGELLLHEGRIAGRYSGIAVDLALPGPETATSGECVDEPTGWISVRDDNAYWYDLVFQPRYVEDAAGEVYENYPYGECEGCGTLYIRGVEQGTVCVDVSSLFDGSLAPPSLEDYVLSVRESLEAR
jgi:hypothetical protein